MAVDVLVNTEDLTVLGSPPVVNVQLDVGATGIRGNKVFVGTGEPNAFTVQEKIFNQEIIAGDLYINNAIGSEYSYMYQYISAPGSNTWVPVLNLNPTIYSRLIEKTFVSGTSTILIPIADIVQNSQSILTEENFLINFSIGYQNPVSASITAVSITGASSDTLSISLKAAELDSGTWSNLSGTVTVHLSITITQLQTEES
jgi:hypothetical protein